MSGTAQIEELAGGKLRMTLLIEHDPGSGGIAVNGTQFAGLARWADAAKAVAAAMTDFRREAARREIAAGKRPVTPA